MCRLSYQAFSHSFQPASRWCTSGSQQSANCFPFVKSVRPRDVACVLQRLRGARICVQGAAELRERFLRIERAAKIRRLILRPCAEEMNRAIVMNSPVETDVVPLLGLGAVFGVDFGERLADAAALRYV